MNRREIEQKIMGKFIEILNLYEQYNPEGEYLTLTFLKDKDKDYKVISGNNIYWKEDENLPINFRNCYDRDEKLYVTEGRY